MAFKIVDMDIYIIAVGFKVPHQPGDAGKNRLS